MTENEISEIILDAAISVHTGIGGPGLLESYYETALVQELRMRGLKVEEQKRIPIIYKGVEIGDPYRLDVLVEDKVIVECKAVEKKQQYFCISSFDVSQNYRVTARYSNKFWTEAYN